MDIFEETKASLVDIWEDNQQRQRAKLVILQAIANVTDVSVKQADEVLDELDRILLKEQAEVEPPKNKGL